ncbi:MAG: hybrid sensor histidine kinase/response regulator [Desulfobacteraceae bacterium]|jgi:signal transduction histidine kinase|nr:hybrid sensor histidine kinase/response regulator [Desulfobacteraceae bacterium]
MKPKILLVDDEKDIREVLALPLSDLGYHIFKAENGAEALRLFKEIQPPIVLTDIKMPGIDGIELLQKIKHENRETEVIMITGHGDMDLAVKSLKYEATDFITKPINVDALEIALKRAQDRIITRNKLREYTESLEQLIREKTELQSHLSSLGLMIGSISHGIKGLLTGLDGGMYLLDSGFSKNNKMQVKEGWEVVKSMVEKIRKMVMDILFYAKERDLKLERIDIRNFSEKLVKELEPKMKSQKIKFMHNFNSGLGELDVDTTYMYSALVNIIENAIDACSQDQSKKSPEIVFSVTAHKKNIIFEISDNGIGMDSEIQAGIFKPFFSSKGSKGTGLGLFVSNTIIQQHGGQIKVKSTSGQGTLFQIKIPKPEGS